MSINIEQDLASILNKLDQKLDKLDEKFEKKLDKVSSDVSEIKTETSILKANQENMKEQLSKIDGSQKAQIWSLITLVTGAFITLAVALFRKMPL
jgi:predicted PurR-regulated permease PerM